MDLPGIRGLLIDIDGTLLVDDRPVPGAAEMIERVRGAGLSFRAATNTTRRPASATAAVLRQAGFDIGVAEIVAPVRLARRRILASGRHRAGLLIPAAAREDLEGVIEDETDPAWVVVGDLGAGFTWERLNAAFGWIRAGAALIALHKNRWWNAPGHGIVLDAGAFVTALEYAAGVAAEVVGKPSPAFFHLALADLGLPPGEVMVVGDDPETDLAGGKAAGCRVTLVRSGKFAENSEVMRAGAGPQPDLVVDSVADLF